MTQSQKTDKIFDNVFRTILEKMPQLMIPLINEAFHTDYRMEDTIVQLKNEHKDITQGVDRITDSLLYIGDKKYHIECQKMQDNTMIIRMFEYDVVIALEEARERSKTGIKEICFPNSCVLYLTHTASMEDSIGIPVRFADGHVHEYQIPVIKAQGYSKEEIFQKNLQVLLPYYILRYEKKLSEYEKNEDKKQQLLEEYRSIKNYLNVATNSEEYSDLVELIKEVLDYVLRCESQLKERLGEIMCGEVMELFSERMLRIGREQECIKAIDKLVNTGIMDLEAACHLLEVSLQDYEKIKSTLQQESIRK